MASVIHVGDVGIALQYQCLNQAGAAIDVSGATTLQIVYMRPDKSFLTVTPTFVTDGTDGWLQYLTQSGDLNQAGIFTAQVHIAWGTSTSWNSDISRFRVWPNQGLNPTTPLPDVPGTDGGTY